MRKNKKTIKELTDKQLDKAYEIASEGGFLARPIYGEYECLVELDRRQRIMDGETKGKLND